MRGTSASGDPPRDARACGFVVWRVRGAAAGDSALRGVSR